MLVGTHIDDKDQGVGFFNLLHSRFCGQRVLDDSIGIQLLGSRDGAARKLGITRELESFRATELNAGVDTLLLLVSSLHCILLGVDSLGYG